MNAISKILEAQKIINNNLASEIRSTNLNKWGKELEVSLFNGVRIYIVYNDFNQYSYSVIYSESKHDRIRYDNYDDRWDVTTKPHHLHLRGSRQTIESKMIGNPHKDMEILVQIVLSI